MGLGVLVPGQGRDLPVAVVGVHRRADREPGDEPPARDHVEHGELLSHPEWGVVQGDRVADHAEGGLRRPAGQAGGDQVGRRHDAVAVLVVLVDPDAVEAQLVGELQLVHVGVVDLVAPLGIEQPGVDVDPHRAVALPEVVRQIRPRHQVEPAELDHRGLPFDAATPRCAPSGARAPVRYFDPSTNDRPIARTRPGGPRGASAMTSGDETRPVPRASLFGDDPSAEETQRVDQPYPDGGQPGRRPPVQPPNRIERPDPRAVPPQGGYPPAGEGLFDGGPHQQGDGPTILANQAFDWESNLQEVEFTRSSRVGIVAVFLVALVAVIVVALGLAAWSVFGGGGDGETATDGGIDSTIDAATTEGLRRGPRPPTRRHQPARRRSSTPTPSGSPSSRIRSSATAAPGSSPSSAGPTRTRACRSRRPRPRPALR